MESEPVVVVGVITVVLTLIGLVVAAYRHIDEQGHDARATSTGQIDRAEERWNAAHAAMRQEIQGAMTLLDGRISASARREELQQVERRMAEGMTRLEDRLERVAGRLEPLPALQAQSEANGEMLRELVSTLTGRETRRENRGGA